MLVHTIPDHWNSSRAVNPNCIIHNVTWRLKKYRIWVTDKMTSNVSLLKVYLQRKTAISGPERLVSSVSFEERIKAWEIKTLFKKMNLNKNNSTWFWLGTTTVLAWTPAGLNDSITLNVQIVQKKTGITGTVGRIPNMKSHSLYLIRVENKKCHVNHNDSHA